MKIIDFLNLKLQKGEGLSLRYDTGETFAGNYRGEFDQTQMTFSFYNISKEVIQIIEIQRIQNLDFTSLRSSVNQS
jgi:hypothetical protein